MILPTATVMKSTRRNYYRALLGERRPLLCSYLRA